jgi:hypothetical protein
MVHRRGTEDTEEVRVGAAPFLLVDSWILGVERKAPIGGCGDAQPRVAGFHQPKPCSAEEYFPTAAT